MREKTVDMDELKRDFNLVNEALYSKTQVERELLALKKRMPILNSLRRTSEERLLRNFGLLALTLLVSCTSLAQFRLDSTIVEANKYNPTQEMKDVVWQFHWEEQLKSDTVSLRPGQDFKVQFNGRDFTFQVQNVLGDGNYRRSFCKWWYLGRDSLGGDTLYTDTLSVPYTDFGYSDLCGNLPFGPSDSLHIGMAPTFYFRMTDTTYNRLKIQPLRISGRGPTTQSHFRVYLSEAPK